MKNQNNFRSNQNPSPWSEAEPLERRGRGSLYYLIAWYLIAGYPLPATNYQAIAFHPELTHDLS